MVKYFHEEENTTILKKTDFTFLTANLTLDHDLASDSPFNLKSKSYDDYFTIAKLEIPRGRAYAFGTRKRNVPMSCRMDSSTGEIEGQYRIVACHPSGYPMVQLGEHHTSEMDTTAPANRTVNPCPDFVKIWILERGYLLVTFRNDVDDEVLVYDDVNNMLRIPITVKFGVKRR